LQVKHLDLEGHTITDVPALLVSAALEQGYEWWLMNQWIQLGEMYRCLTSIMVSDVLKWQPWFACLYSTLAQICFQLWIHSIPPVKCM